ncbi:plasmid recombination protein [bacterium]|nr:plasmid recombination protein [bacterium]
MYRVISHCQGKGSLSHNNRTFQPKNADPNRKKDNIILVKESVADAYIHLFAEAVEEYNNKQKRNDRKIDDYYKSLFGRKPCNSVLTGNNKQKSFYEDLVQIGDMHDTPVGSDVAEIAKQCLVEYMKEWNVRNPNLYVFNAVIHMDEKTPHLHIDYIPVGHYKRGMSVQNGLAQALKEMGYGSGKDAINRWRKAERDVFADICFSHGLDVAEEEPGRGHSFTVDEYKEYQDQINELKSEIEAYEDELTEKINMFEAVSEAELNFKDIDNINSHVKSKKALNGSESVNISRSDYDKLLDMARAGVKSSVTIMSLENTISKLNKQVANVSYLTGKVVCLTKTVTNLENYKQSVDEFLLKKLLYEEWYQRCLRLEFEQAKFDRAMRTSFESENNR